MLPENPSFLVRGDDGQEYGPVDLDELRDWVRENRAGLGTEVRVDEPGAPWHAWQNYPELVALLAEVNVTGPASGLAIAPVWRRIAAWLMDIFLLEILLNPLQLLLKGVIPMRDLFQASFNPAVLQSMPTSMLLQIAAFIMIYNAFLVLYFTICHAVYGRTAAKAILGIRVVDQQGRKPALVKAFVRALALIFSVNLFFPLLYAFLNPQRRTFHDLVAGTCVVNA